MPRGNDTEAGALFSAQLFEQYGIHSNAAEMIEAHRANQDPAVHRASMTAVDEDATAEAQGDLDAVADKLELADGDTVLDAAVRGNALVAVVENVDSGITRKVVGPWNENYAPPVLTPAERAAQATAKRNREVAVETQRLQAEAEAEIAQAREDAQAHVAEELAKIREEKDAALAAAIEEANAEDEDAEPDDTTDEGDDGEEVTDDSGVKATAGAVQLADEEGIDLSTVTGTGRLGRITKEDVQAVIDGG